MAKPIALVTGASRGIGHELAKALVNENYEVFGTSRHPETLPDFEKIPNVKFLLMDLLNPDTIEKVISQFNTIDLLINNAGYSQIGSVEEISFEKIEEIFDVNLFGQMRLIKGFLPIMRKQRSGTILNITSMAGTNPMPFSTVYAAAKAGFNKISQGLRHELAPFNIKVIAIAPLYANTAIVQNQDYKENSPYIENINRAKQSRRNQLNTSSDPKLIASQIMNILQKKHPKWHYTVGKNAWLMGFMLRHFPQKFVERSIQKRFGVLS
jgi:short-subunit dehydrogenase